MRWLISRCWWCVQGKFLVLAGLKAINGQLEFFNVDELETMATGEHYMATDVDWDPTGRSDHTKRSILSRLIYLLMVGVTQCWFGLDETHTSAAQSLRMHVLIV